MRSRKKINWEGSFFIEHSLAKVNRELCKRLIEECKFDIGTIPYEQDNEFIIDDDYSAIRNLHVKKDEWANITIRHQWPPNFQKPQSDKWILFQPWEYGAIPKEWYVPMKHWIDEIWVYSTYNKEAYVRSGIPENKIKVIPLGVDKNIFHYDVKPMSLKTKKMFQFLFVGGTIFRKGIDVLIKAYTEEFSADEDVSLVIKDFGTESFYKGATIGDWITEHQKDSQNPEILYLNETFSVDDLSSLYKTCDCLVHPYRGEGFGLPIIEAMACGTPVIVPSLGPSLDFCNEDTAFFVECQEERWSTKAIGDIETVDYPWWLKVDENELRKQMRYVFNNRELVKQKGRRASNHILSKFTWDQSASIVSNRIEEILSENLSIEMTGKDYVNSEMNDLSDMTEQFPINFIEVHDQLPSTLSNSLSVEYRKALSYVVQKDYTQALHCLYQIKEKMQDETKQYQAEIWNSIGVCLTHNNEFKKAHEAFQLAVKLDSSNSELAIECYKKMLNNMKEDPLPSELAEYYQSLGTLYFEMGNDFEAERMYQKGLELNPKSTEIEEKLKAIKEHALLIKDKYIDNKKAIDINNAKDLYDLLQHSFEGEENILRKQRRQWVNYFRAGDKVLDIGCGNGFFIEMLQEAGVNAVGIDIDQHKVIQGHAKGLNIQRKRAEYFLNDKKEEYDGIFLGYIIEHLPVHEVLHLLIQCTKALKRSGKLIILSPNIENPIASESFWLHITHVRPYPKLLLIHILELLGLYVKETQLLEDATEYSVVAQKNCYEILWTSPVMNASGYAEEQKEFLHSLKPFPLKIKLAGNEIEPKPEIQAPKTLHYLMALKANHLQHPLIHYQAGPAYQFSTPRAPISIGRTMFETDAVPIGWLNKMNSVTEIWVPSEFNKKTFCDAGLDENKIFILPGAIDVEKYNPEKVKPYKLKDEQSFHFLTVFDWSLRKGWDVLIQAYLEEFQGDENVSLILKVYKMLNSHSNPHEDILQIAKKIGKRNLPRIELIDSYMKNEQLIQLYAAADSFVLPSRGEGWGRPYMEAMAMGLPTIGTRWSAQVDYMNDDNSYLIDVEKLTLVDQSMPLFYHGHHWAQPNVDHLKQLMRKIFENQEEAKRVGIKAREHMLSHYSHEKIAKMMYQRLDNLVQKHYR